jgi:citrate lyase subunit beta/citryl-CoA lyase
VTEPFAGPALLFCPADRPDRFRKAAAAADVVIIDLEDGVAPADKETARRHLLEVPLDPRYTVVRINPADSADHELDLAALAETEYRTVMLAKAEHARDIRRLGNDREGLPEAGTRLAGATGRPLRVIALCETALGVLNAGELAAEPATVAVMWGAEDLIVSLGGRSSRHPDGRYRGIALHARNQVLLAAGGHGKAAIDAVHLDIADRDGLRGETEDAAASGFAAKACIHPSQVPVVRQSFAPTAADLAWARALLLAAETSPGVFSFEGKMVDQPVVSQATRMLRAARPDPADRPTEGTVQGG